MAQMKLNRLALASRTRGLPLPSIRLLSDYRGRFTWKPSAGIYPTPLASSRTRYQYRKQPPSPSPVLKIISKSWFVQKIKTWFVCCSTVVNHILICACVCVLQIYTSTQVFRRGAGQQHWRSDRHGAQGHSSTNRIHCCQCSWHSGVLRMGGQQSGLADKTRLCSQHHAEWRCRQMGLAPWDWQSPVPG